MKTFSETTRRQCAIILQRYANKEAGLLPILHLAQKEFGIIDYDVMEYIAHLLDIEPIKVLDAVSFYTLFKTQKEAKYIIQVCSTLSCSLMGSGNIIDHLKRRLDTGINEISPDGRFKIVKVECLGSCGTAPVIKINDRYYENLNEEKVDEIINSLSLT